MWKRFFLFSFLSCSGSILLAQQVDEKCTRLKVGEKVLLDSLSVLKESINFPSIDSLDYTFQYDLSTGVFEFQTTNELDSVQVCYQTIPFSFHTTRYFRSLDIYDSTAIFKDPVDEGPFLQREELFVTQDINKSGSISRGISFGSNQDVFVNSTLNLNLDGKLADDLYIQAAITDQNIPFQPEGNTQQLQDFDKVYIKLYNDRFSIIGGDVVLKNKPGSYFLKYYKNVQGGLGTVNYSLGAGDTASTSLGISVAKGRFSSIQIPPKEGVLGPYQVPGPEGQDFVIILANSERVFLDGKQLKRGFSNDYVIDYNSAEVTFTNNVLITQFSRIRVDYEFSDQDYNRTITTAAHTHRIGKLKVGIDYYSEKDNKNRPLLVDLTNNEKQLLSEVGDNLGQAITSSADSVGYNEDAIRYAVKDTIVDGISYSIYQYSTDEELAVYQLSFSEVGQGNGNYVQFFSTANGRVYEWVPPNEGRPQGNFEPIIQLPAPDKRQLVSTHIAYELTDYETLTTDAAFSGRDLNLYSTLDSEDDNGKAIKTGFVSSGRELAFLPGYKINFFSSFEYNDRYFQPIDRFRYIEFDRDWNYDPKLYETQADEHITTIGFGLNKNFNNRFSYELTHRNKTGQMNGLQQNFSLIKTVERVRLSSSGFLMNNDLSDVEADWRRFSADVSYHNDYIVPGYRYALDQNKITSSEVDSVVRSAMYYNEQLFYLQNGEKVDWDFRLQHAVRIDKLPVEGGIEEFARSNTSQLNLSKDFDNHRIETVFTYRTLEQVQTDDTDEVISGRLNWQGHMLDSHVKTDITYSIANSQELRREYIFIQVASGQGTHTWRDLNEDGVKDLNEFFIAINADEKNYAKIFIPTNEYITAFQNLFLARLNMEFPRQWRKELGLKRFLSRLSNSTAWTADSKTTDDDPETRALAFAKSISEETLIYEKNNLRSTIFYNRANPVYGLDITYLNSSRKQLLADGFDFSSTEQWDLNLRYNLSASTTFKIKSSTGEKVSGSDFLEGRDFLIDSYRINPEIAWQPTSSFRLSGQYNYLEKYNNYTLESSETAFFNEWIGEARYNKSIKSALNIQFRYATIDFSGEANSPVGYDMLNALQPGTNISWTLNWQQRLISGLQLNISYDGRKSGELDVIHVGRVQLSALF